MADAAFYNALKPTRLTQGISSTETTVRVAAVEDFSGNAIDSSDIGNGLYGIFEPKTTGKREFFKVTAISGTTLTVARGGLPQAPYTFSGTGVSHAAGVRVILSTNAPALYNTFANKENDESISGLWTFDDAYRPKLDADVDTANATDFITLGQLNRTALGTTLTDRLIVAGTAGATLAAGNLVYFDETDNEWKLTDADTPSTVNNVLLGIAQGAGTNGNAITGGVLLFGIDANQSGMTAGDYMYAGNTAGSISSSPGTTEVTVGIARSATELMFAPRFNQHITEAQQDLLDAITASAAELNILDGYTGTTADLNEASAIVQATDITGAELETLSSGATSNADTLHTHTILPSFFPATDWLQGTGTPTNPLFQVTSDPTGAYLYSVRLSGSSPNLSADIKRYDRDAITGNYYYNGVSASLTESGGDVGSGTTWAGICAGDTYVYVSVENSANSNIAIYRFAKDLSGETTMTISGTASTDNGKLAGNDTVLYVSEEGTSTNVKPYTISGTTATRGVDFTIAVQSQYRRGWWFDGTDLLFADANDSLKVKRYNVSGTLQATSSAQVYTETGFFEAGTPVGIGFFKTGAIYLIALRKQTDGTTIETYTIEGVGITKP